MKRFIILFATVILCLSVLYTKGNDHELQATTTMIDDSQLGEKIVEITHSAIGATSYAITEKGEVYAWGNNHFNQLYNGEPITPSSISLSSSSLKPKKMLNFPDATDGKRYLSDVKQIVTSELAFTEGAIMILKNDGTVYAWGKSTGTTFGKPDGVYTTPQKLNIGTADNPVVKIYMGVRRSMFLTKNGEVYVIGTRLASNNNGGGIDTTFTQLTKDVNGNTLPKMKDIGGCNVANFLLSETGTLYSYGYNGQTGTGDTAYGTYVTKPKITIDKDGNPLTDVTEITEGAEAFIRRSDGSFWLVKAYDENTPNTGGVPYLNRFFELNDFVNLKAPEGVLSNPLEIRLKNAKLTVVSSDHKAYFSSYVENISNHLYASKVTLEPYIANDLTQDYNHIIKGEGSFADNRVMDDPNIKSESTLFLNDKGAVYANGKRVGFGNVLLHATNTLDEKIETETKQNDTLTIHADTSSETLYEIDYKKEDLITGNVSTPQQAVSTVTVQAEENKRIYEKYSYYIRDQEDTSTVTYVVDIFKKTPITSDVRNNGKYPQGKKITFDAVNGLEGNTMTATLKKDSDSPQAYTSGTVINDVGTYEFTLSDQYGNTNTYTFTITTDPIAEAVVFTKNAGDFVYGEAITKNNTEIGTFSLRYPAGKPTSAIKTMALGTKLDEDHFELQNNKTLKIKNGDLNAGTYRLFVSGLDENDMPFEGEVEIVIAPAAQTMRWNTTTENLKNTGLSIGENVTVGVEQITGAGVTKSFHLKKTDACISLNESTGELQASCVPSPSTITIQAIPSGNSNYDETPISIDIEIKKQTITLDVVLMDREDTTYKSSVSILQGDALPSLRVEAGEGVSINMDDWGEPTYIYTKNDIEHQNPSQEAGTYKVCAVYDENSKSNMYDITWNCGELIVKGVEITEDNLHEFVSFTSNQKAYVPGAWTNAAIMIEPKHPVYSTMQIDLGTASKTTQTYNVEGDHQVTLLFSTDDGITISTSVSLKIDTTAPVVTEFVYTDKTNVFRSILKSITFDHFFKDEQTVSFRGTDVGSGITSYRYTIIELNGQGVELTATKKTGTLKPTESIDLIMNKNYKISVEAIDYAGNPSASKKTEVVQISNELGKLNIQASVNGEPYDGSSWVHDEIDIALSGTSPAGVLKYQFTTDGQHFQDIMSSDGTLRVPNPLQDQNHVEYTFRAVNQDGSFNDANMYINVDTKLPVVDVKGIVGDREYDGLETDQEVEIIPYQTQVNLSDVTYYYTTDAQVADTDPQTNMQWIRYTGTLKHHTNGTITYYFKGVSKAGLSSRNATSITIKIAKKEYTKVTAQVSTEGKTYQQGSWAKHDITFTLQGGLKDPSQIGGYDYTITNGAKPNASAGWQSVTGNELQITDTIDDKVYWFRIQGEPNNATVSEGYRIKLDCDLPQQPTYRIEEVNTSVFARFINTISYGQWMNKEVRVIIESDDTTSGIDHYTYIETSPEGSAELTSKTGVLRYGDETNVTLRAIAYDQAGNASKAGEESDRIQIDQTAPIIQGVQDNKVYKHYYIPRYVEVLDNGSGIDYASFSKNNGPSVTFAENYKFKEIGVYQLKVFDIAENETRLTFELKDLPNIEAEIDGSDESKVIIDQIRDEFEEEYRYLDSQEKKDYQKWINDALEKWNSKRMKVVENEEKSAKVEAVSDDVTFDPSVVLITEKLAEHKVPSLPRKAIAIYNVYLEKGGVQIQPNGDVKVYLPYAEDTKPILYQIDENGSVKEIPCMIEENHISFITKSLLKYAISNIAQEENKKPDPAPIPKPDPKPDPDDEDKHINIDSDKDGKPDVNVDVDCDGKADINIDTDDDGYPNVNIDTTGDGKPNYNIDIDGDGKADVNIGPVRNPWKPDKCQMGTCKEYCTDSYYKPYLNIDTDNDGRPDINLDLNKDMEPDLNIDLNFDNIPDIDIDSTGDTAGSPPDGKPDINVDVDHDGIADINLVQLSKWTPDKDVDGKIKYDTMSGLKPVYNIDTTGDGKADENLADNSNNQLILSGGKGTANQTKVDSTYPQGSGGANTGDAMDWSAWWIMMAVSIASMSFAIHHKVSKRKLQK